MRADSHRAHANVRADESPQRRKRDKPNRRSAENATSQTAAAAPKTRQAEPLRRRKRDKPATEVTSSP
jgi:hypothetical protein